MKPKDQTPLIRVLVADSLPVYREGLIVLLEKKHRNIKCTAAETGHEVINLIRKQAFDILLLDEEMPGLSGYEVLGRVKQQKNAPRILLMALKLKTELLKKVIDKEVESFLCKDCTVEQYYEAICNVVKNGYHVSPLLAQQLLEENYRQVAEVPKPLEEIVLFSEDERRMIRLVKQGNNYREMGVLEHRSKRTIEEWTRKIKTRLGCKYFKDVVLYAIKTGQIEG